MLLLELNQDAQTGKPVFGFEHEDFFIHEPRLSECGRFRVDPLATYGISEAAAEAIEAINAMLSRAGAKAIDGAMSALRSCGFHVTARALPHEGT